MIFFLWISSLGLSHQIHAGIELSMGYFETKTQTLEIQNLESDKIKSIKVPIKSFKSGIALRDHHIYERLGATKNPYIHFRTLTQTKYRITGELFLNGVKRKISANILDTASAKKAIFHVLLSDFNVKDLAILGYGVKDRVSIEVKISKDKRVKTGLD